ncbi:MAG: hypothetical protein KJN99_03200 [Marinicaulis sp.]|nr:hypothetical protein [Marinicaulis sp.]
MSKIRTKILAVIVAGFGFSPAAFASDEVDMSSDPRVGEKVDRICFGRSIDGFKEADGYKRAVLVEQGVNDWFLLKLIGACSSRDFGFAHKIGIESRPAGGCVRRGDAILVESTPGFVNRCSISAIYEWDDDADAPSEIDRESEDGESEG